MLSVLKKKTLRNWNLKACNLSLKFKSEKKHIFSIPNFQERLVDLLEQE